MSGMQPLAPKTLISQINANAAPQQAYNLMDPNTVPLTVVPPPPVTSQRSPLDQRSPSNASQQSGSNRSSVSARDLSSLANTGTALYNQGKFNEAEPYYFDCYQKMASLLGDSHPSTLGAQSNLAILYYRQRRFEEAEPIFLSCLVGMRGTLGDVHGNTLTLMNNLASLYREMGSLDQSEVMYLDCLGKMKQSLGEKHPETLNCMANLAGLDFTLERYDKAEMLWQIVVENRKVCLGDRHADTVSLSSQHMRPLKTISYDDISSLMTLSYMMQSGTKTTYSLIQQPLLFSGVIYFELGSVIGALWSTGTSRAIVHRVFDENEVYLWGFS